MTHYGWHFLRQDMHLGFEDGRLVRVGKSMRFRPASGDRMEPWHTRHMPRLCARGMHASSMALHAIRYAPGPIICRVIVSGDVVKGDDKMVGRDRRVLWMADAYTTLWEFACDWAESFLFYPSYPLADLEIARAREAIDIRRQMVRSPGIDVGQYDIDRRRLAQQLYSSTRFCWTLTPAYRLITHSGSGVMMDLISFFKSTVNLLACHSGSATIINKMERLLVKRLHKLRRIDGTKEVEPNRGDRRTHPKRVQQPLAKSVRRGLVRSKRGAG